MMSSDKFRESIQKEMEAKVRKLNSSTGAIVDTARESILKTHDQALKGVLAIRLAAIKDLNQTLKEHLRAGRITRKRGHQYSDVQYIDELQLEHDLLSYKEIIDISNRKKVLALRYCLTLSPTVISSLQAATQDVPGQLKQPRPFTADDTIEDTSSSEEVPAEHGS